MWRSFRKVAKYEGSKGIQSFTLEPFFSALLESPLPYKPTLNF
jgi:hypothetical protein